MAKNKFTTFGQLLKSKKGNPYVRLGKTGSKDPKYDYTVKVQLKDGNGNVVMLTNPTLQLFDPRKQKNKDGTTRNVPDFILNELVFIDDDVKGDSEDFS